MTDPRGRWFRVYARQIRQHPKFHDLTAAELGAWTALRCEAELRDEAAFIDRADAMLILRRRKTPKPAMVLQLFISRHLFDEQADGRLLVHDRADHDRPKYPSDEPEETAERQRKSRASHEGVTTDPGSGHDTHARGQQAEPAPALSLQPAAPAEDLPAESDPVTFACRYLPNGGRWLSDRDYRAAWDDLVRRFSSEWVVDAIPKAYADCLKRGTVRAWDLKRFAEWHLASRNREEELGAEKHREEAEAKARAEHQQKLKDATPAEKEQARLQKLAIRIGLEQHIPVPSDPREVRKFVMKHSQGAA